MSEPEILFMDEPTRSLDPISAVAIREFVAEHIVGELGSTVVLATHSMPEAEALCRRLAFIQDGRIVAEGSVPELRRGDRLRDPLRAAAAAGGRHGRGRPGAIARRARGPAGSGPSPRPRRHAAGGPVDVRLTLAEDESPWPASCGPWCTAGADVVGCETRDLSLEEIYVHTLTSGAAAAPRLVRQAAAR